MMWCVGLKTYCDFQAYENAPTSLTTMVTTNEVEGEKKVNSQKSEVQVGESSLCSYNLLLSV